MIERIANFVTLIVVIVVFTMSACAYFIPPRGVSRLRVALCGLDLTVAFLFTLSLLALFDPHVHLPQPEINWALRFAFAGFGLGKIVEMLRAGAYRRIP